MYSLIRPYLCVRNLCWSWSSTKHAHIKFRELSCCCESRVCRLSPRAYMLELVASSNLPSDGTFSKHLSCSCNCHSHCASWWMLGNSRFCIGVKCRLPYIKSTGCVLGTPSWSVSLDGHQWYHMKLRDLIHHGGSLACNAMAVKMFWSFDRIYAARTCIKMSNSLLSRLTAATVVKSPRSYYLLEDSPILSLERKRVFRMRIWNPV